MGLFSRNEPSGSTGRRSSSRTSSEAQAAELRVRARRRLIGALVLVLTAVIFVPMLFDAPPQEELPSPVVLPDAIPPLPAEPQVALAPEPAQPSSGGSIDASSNEAGAIGADGSATEPETVVVPDTRPPAEPPAKPEPAEPQPEPAPQPEKPAPKPAPSSGRTDDGSVALALLEGRQPAQAAAPARPQSAGSFVLQVAAYTTQADAQSRREKLAAAGVTNAYVEDAIANGKTAYRLRVGPFPTREAAEAAQARLRQLGYNNGLIFNK